MGETGDYLVPRFQGQPFFDKPILSYWLMAGAFEAFGPGAGAARAVSAVAALGVVLATAWLGRVLFGEAVALAGAVVLATTLAFVAFGRTAMSDMLLAFFTTSAVAFGVRALREPEEGPRRWFLFGVAAALGLGFATKGPVAWLMAGLPLAFAWWPRRRQPLASAATLALAAGVVLLLGGGWFAALYLREGASPLAYFFLKENLERFAGEAYDVGRPFWYYPPAYLLAGLPWSLFLVPALRRVREDAGATLLALWVLAALVPLSLSRGKLDYYLLPLYPALALLVGRFFTAASWNGFDVAWVRGALVACAASFLGLTVLQRRFDAHWLPEPGIGLLFTVVAGASALACLAAAARPRPGPVGGVLAGATAAVGLLLVAFFLPAFREAQPNRELAEDVHRELTHRPEAQVVACADPARVERDVLFEARATVRRRCDLWDVAPAASPFLFVLQPEEFASLARVPGFREVARYRYLPAATLTLSGFLEPRPAASLVLAANFATTDPLAETRRKKRRKQELRTEGEP